MTPSIYLFPCGSLVAAWDRSGAVSILNDELQSRGLPLVNELPIRINPEDAGVLILKEPK